MYPLFVLCSIVFSVCVDGRVLKNDLFRLDIVHYNDFHARFEETTISYPVCKSNDTTCLGGYARLYYEIKSLLKEKPGALLLNAGDTFQGTYWYTLLKWNITQKFINLLPNDAHTIGNHEFDDGVAGVAPYLAALHAPVVVANIDTSLEPSLNGLYKPHIILKRKGRRIGIIGLITTETKTSSSPEKVKFLDPIAAVQREAQYLTDQGVDIILVLSHCGLAVDKKIASSVGENIDVIIGGHSHSLLWNGNAPSKEYVAGPYPVLVKTKENPDHEVLIVTAACFTKYLGNLTVYFDQMGNLKDFSGAPVFLNRSIPEDPEIKALLKPYSDKLHSMVSEKVGVVEDNFLSTPCGSRECPIGDFVADALLDASKEMNVSNLTHVAFLLRNMMRGSIPKGDITRGEIINVLPFTNTVATFTLRGKYLKDAFRNCMRNYWIAKPFEGPWMPQIAGLQLTLNLRDNLTMEVLVKEGDKFVALDPEKEYQVTTFNFIIKGGNGFDMLKNYGKNMKIVGKDSDILEKYIRKQSPIVPTLDNRLTVLIVTAACFTKYLGNLTVYFDQMGNLKDFSGAPVFLNRSIPEDPEIKALLKPYSDKLHSMVSEKVGVVEDNFLSTPCGSRECPIGDFVADALLDASKEMNVSNLTHVAFLLRNMMRGSIPKGDITRGEIINVLPFTNTVATFTLRGKYLKDAFRNCMRNYWIAKPFEGPWMPQIAGLQLTLNLRDNLTMEVLVKEGDKFVALDPEKEYQVTTFNFIIKGGNGFDMLKNYGKNMKIVGKDSDILEKYIRKQSPIVPTLDNRLTVLIVTAACFTKYLGNLTVYFDQMGNLKDFSGAPVFLNRSIPEDPEIKALLKPYSDKLHSMVSEKVGVVEDNFLSTPCGSRECPIGDFVADALLDASKEMNVSNLTHVAFLLRNMMRGSIPKGDITRGEIINVLPFTNTVATFTLRGKYLKDAFRNCMRNYWIAKPFEGPWMPQIAGLQLTLNLRDNLTMEVLVKEGDKFVALDPEKEYQVTTFNFIIKGGNGFDMLKNYGKNMKIVGKDSDILEKYIRKQSPIVPTLDNRLTVIN